MSTLHFHKNSIGQPIGLALPEWHIPLPLAPYRFKGRYCHIEPLVSPLHAHALYEANALDTNDSGWTYMAYGPFEQLTAFEQWVKEAAQSTDPLFHALVDPFTQKAVGVASYLRIDRSNGVIEIGHLKFSPRMQQSRMATEALYQFIKHSFDLGFRRCEWKCDALNAPSRRAAQRLGFQFEGIFRQASVYKGRNRDTAWYAIIDKDWPHLQSAFKQWLNPANFDNNGQQILSLSGLTAPLIKTSEKTTL
ncbi:MAG: GNAT family protein [Betaproteobacteria bacterium]